MNSASSFRNALVNAVDGDEILLAPGVYAGGGFFRDGLTGVVIRSEDVNNRAIIDATGVGEGIKLESADRVTISDLIIQNASQNGINIDDGGFRGAPVDSSTNIIMRNLLIRNGGGHGIKFHGVDHFLIENVNLVDWGDGHAAFNFLGVHDGIVQNSFIRRTNTSGGFGIKVEGGSSDVTIRANRFVESGERAIQFGGGIDADDFRPQPPGDVAASDIFAEGNVIMDRGAAASGIRAAIAYINVNGTTFRNNLVFRPRTFVGRISKENNTPGFVDTQNGVFKDNIIIFETGDFSRSQPFSTGDNTLPATFHFEGNTWFNAKNAANSTVTPPAPEIGGIYGVDPGVNSDSVIPWEFDWGMWLVNATQESKSIDLGASASLVLATPNDGAKFDIGLANPLIGDWTLSPLSSSLVELEAFSHIVLVTPTSGDYNQNGGIDAGDYTVWRDTLGSSIDLRADGDNSGTVTEADYDIWKTSFDATRGTGASSQLADDVIAVAEPSTNQLWVAMLVLLSLTCQLPARRPSRFKACSPRLFVVDMTVVLKARCPGS